MADDVNGGVGDEVMVTSPLKSKVALVPQLHGGAIKQGGNPGHRGGGRPPSYVRAVSRQAYLRRVPILKKLADDDTLPAKTRIDAIKALAIIGNTADRELEPQEVKARVERMAALVREYVPPHLLAECMAKFHKLWR